MNRREALKLLATLPAVKSIEVANLAPNDVIVIECDEVLSMETAERIKMYVSQVWPNRKCIVLSKGMTLRIAREGARGE